MDCEAAKRMEDFAKEILRQTPAMQKKMWEALEPVLTADEIHGLKCYVGLFYMFTDERYFESIKKSVGEQLYNELHKWNQPPAPEVTKAERRHMTDIGRICPICGNTYTARPAISRADNETEICPECGTREALAVWRIARMVRENFVPVPGHTYCNEGGGSYKCISVSPLTGDARMRNVKSGWTFDAHGVGIYPNGSIDWDWSKNGCFTEGE